MMTVRRLGLLSLVLAGVAMVGCDKKIKLTFVNDTPQAREVEFTTPDGTVELGTIRPAGKVSEEVKIAKDDLPARCSYTAGDMTGQFTILKDSPGSMIIYVDKSRDVGPGNKKTEMKTKKEKEVKDKVVEEGTVVE